MIKHICNFGGLLVAFLFELFGVLLFKSLYKDFSLFDPSHQMIFPFLASAVLITLGVYIGFMVFKKMKNS